jgi:hypothetical protein
MKMLPQFVRTAVLAKCGSSHETSDTAPWPSYRRNPASSRRARSLRDHIERLQDREVFALRLFYMDRRSQARTCVDADISPEEFSELKARAREILHINARKSTLSVLIPPRAAHSA